MSSLRIVGIDPGFAHIGLCSLDLFPQGGSELLNATVVSTRPTPGRAKQLDDELRRLAEIEDIFTDYIQRYNPDVAVIEEPGKCLMKRQGKWATNPALLRTSCLMWGAAHGICRSNGIYCIKVGSKDIKYAVCGKKNASKGDIIETVKSRYPTFDGWPETKKIEHAADAVGAVIASLNDGTIMVMLKKLGANV